MVKEKNGPKFILDIEGEPKPWDKETITTEEIANLGGWNASLGVILIDKDNNERTLKPGEIVELKPGMGFSKKIHFRRGLVVREERIKKRVGITTAKIPGAGI